MKFGSKGRNTRKPTSKRNTWESSDKTSYGFQGKPETEGTVKDHISIVANKDLPKSSFAVKADPYTAALPGSEPYPIVNRFNTKINSGFAGDDNIDGGNVQQYANSFTSTLLKYFDFIRAKIVMRYRYLPISPESTANYPGYNLIEEMRKSIAEAVSILQSTTFHQLQINQFAVETDLPMGSAKTTNISKDNTPINAYTNLTDVLYAMSIYYQVFLQNVNSVFGWHNSFRMKQGTMIRCAWNREVPVLNSFFGLMNKKSFLSLLNSISLSFQGEYFDKGYADQIADFTFIPSRRSDSITDPVLELQAGFAHPKKFNVYVLGTDGKIVGSKPEDSLLFSDAMMKYSVAINQALTSVTIWEACDKLRDLLSAQQTMLWARQLYNTPNVDAENQRFNNIKSYFDVIIACFAIFKPRWSDFRECFDTMSRTGTLSWVKGYFPITTQDTDMKLFHNMIVDNIYSELLGGATALEYSTTTKRWTSYSKWNMYTGIPAYDLKQGGFFIACASKSYAGDNDNEQIPYLPVAFDPWINSNNQLMAATSRDGKQALVKYTDMIMSTSKVFSRLVPLSSQADIKIRVPVVKFNDNSSLTLGHFSTLYKTLTQIFGLCSVQTQANGVYDDALDPDIVAIYQIEYSDITNTAITYARANAPFRGTTSQEGILGFWGVVK